MLGLTLVAGAERADGAPVTMELPAGRMRLVIGRDPACDWALPDRSLAVSARHCEIVRTSGGLVLRDLSTNGTFVNGAEHRIDGDHALDDGDRIELGPYVIAVRLSEAAPAVGLATPPAQPQVAAASATSVEDTAPIVMAAGRGRDPASALQMPEPDDLGLTRIRPAPAAASPARSPSQPPAAPAAAAPVRASPSPAPAAPRSPPPPPPPPPGPSVSTAGSTGLAVAQALGLPPSSLSGIPDEVLLARVGALARAAVEALRGQLAQQARARRLIGSRRGTQSPLVPPLQLAADTDTALRLLLAGDPASALREVATELDAHHSRMLGAFSGAAAKLASELEPAALARVAPGGDLAAKEALYAVLWQQLGLAEPGSDWATGLQAAARIHLAAAYDDDEAAVERRSGERRQGDGR